MRQWIWIGLLLWTCAFTALAGGGPSAVRKQVESSMLVTGTIDIEPDGSVGAHALDHPGSLTADIVKLIGDKVPAWRFDPVVINGNAVRARARMSLRLVAKKLDNGSYSVAIRNAHFGNPPELTAGRVASTSMAPPQYPMAALQAGITGTAYLVVKVGQHGTVEDVVAEQVNLRVVGSARQMEQGREALAQAALRAAKRWTFKPPPAGEEAKAKFWSVRVPVDFRIGDARNQPKYGDWETYVPGPKRAAPWVPEGDATQNPDAMVAGGLYPVGQGLRLLTPPGQG